MTAEQQMVLEFMLHAGQDCPAEPTIPPKRICDLRITLIQEELNELSIALTEENLQEAYDATIDLMFVVIGTGVAMGLDLEYGFQEVFRSNMSKFIDGYKREDGKWVKGPSYSPANLKPIIDAQIKNSNV